MKKDGVKCELMSPQKEMCVFAENINLTLFNDIIAFVLDAAAVAWNKRSELRHRCMLLYNDTQGSTFQEKYGFLYLGELLERYEERFGMTAPDRRAIALALGYTSDIVTKEMFVGNQQINFLREIQRYADGDIYLTGALYLLNEGQSEGQSIADKLKNTQYTRTEELIFAMSLFSDFKEIFPVFKPQLLRLLGKERNMPILGNTGILNWMITAMQPVGTLLKAKDTVLLRTLCSLPSSFVKEGSRQYNILLENGYTPLEIVYANVMPVMYQSGGKTLRMDSVVTEKIVVSLFQTVFAFRETLPTEIYNQLSGIFSRYENFSIKCYDKYSLLDVLRTDSRIENVSTFVWFSQYAAITDAVFDKFDLMNPVWDSVAVSLSPEKYKTLFECRLHEDLSQEDIQQQIERYNDLTGSNYLDAYTDLQQELIQNPAFAAYLAELLSLLPDSNSQNLFMLKLDSLVEVCRDNARDITAYPVCGLMDVLEPDNFEAERRLVFLENFLPMMLDYERWETVILNLRVGIEIPLSLNETQKKFLCEPFLAKNALFASTSFEEIWELVNVAPVLPDIFRFLFQNGVSEELRLKDYQSFAGDAQECYDLLTSIATWLGAEQTGKFISLWQKNACPMYELRRMERRITANPEQDWETVFCNYAGYINLLYGQRFKNLYLSDAAHYQESVLIYAISHQKKHFIRLLDENVRFFHSLPPQSVLFDRKVYEEFFNLNELTEKDLTDCGWMITRRLHTDMFTPGRLYTFSELKVLYNIPKVYVSFYHMLTSESTDYRLKYYGSF